MARFNRTRLIEQLRVMAVRAQEYNRFDHNNGTAQLRPRQSDDKQDALIDKAVAYGRWRALQDMVADLESGNAGT
jgi:putative heme degradation protein